MTDAGLLFERVLFVEYEQDFVDTKYSRQNNDGSGKYAEQRINRQPYMDSFPLWTCDEINLSSPSYQWEEIGFVFCHKRH